QIEEGLVAHRPLQPQPLRDLPEHGRKGVALALPALAGHGDVQAVRVQDRPGGERHDHAFGDHLAAFVVEGEGPEHRLLRVAVMQDRKGFVASRELAEVDRWRGPGPGSGRWACRRPPALPLLRLELLAKFLPALLTATTGSVVAPCIDGPARKLDCERPVP